jgi:hypothetical protein
MEPSRVNKDNKKRWAIPAAANRADPAGRKGKPGASAGLPLFLRSSGLKISQPGDAHEHEADRAAKAVTESPPSLSENGPASSGQESFSLSQIQPAIQRSPIDDASTADATQSPPSDQSPAQAPSASEADAGVLIVDDSVMNLAPGQMRRSDFLAQLRDAVSSTAEDALTGTVWSVVGCPWIDRWFNYYSDRDSQQIERSIHKYAPETTAVTSATDYIPIICERVRRAIGEWSASGALPGIAGASAGASDGGSAAGDGEPTSAASNIFFKGDDGGAKESHAPQAVQSQLGSGRPLDGGVKSHMESSFGQNFSHVRLHTGPQAAQVSEEFNARAFTIGPNIAFGAGQYRPGTLIGDALIAHELAHVMQQSGSASTAAPVRHETSGANPLEEEADLSAVGVMMKMWGHALGGLNVTGREMLPRLRTGLRLSRCSADQVPNPQGIHFDQGGAVTGGGSPSGSLKDNIPGLTRDESATKEEMLANMSTVNAGGVYIFFGHSISNKTGVIGIKSSDSKTVEGSEISKSLARDKNPPTMVILGGCASEALLEKVAEGGVPIAVGFTENIASISGASAVTEFMTELKKGSTFAKAKEKADDFASRFGMAQVAIVYADGYGSDKTLEEARKQHKGEVGK